MPGGAAAVCLGRGISLVVFAWQSSSGLPWPRSLALGLANAAGLFEQHYFGSSTARAGNRTTRFAPSALEPKQAALAEVLRDGGAPGQVDVDRHGANTGTRSRWTIWRPESNGLRVRTGPPVARSVAACTRAKEQASLVRGIRRQRVESGGARAFCARRGLAYRETQINDYAGQPVLVALRPGENATPSSLRLAS